MKDELVKAIKALTKKAGESESAIDTQQFAQAVLNLSNALIGLEIQEIK